GSCRDMALDVVEVDDLLWPAVQRRTGERKDGRVGLAEPGLRRVEGPGCPRSQAGARLLLLARPDQAGGADRRAQRAGAARGRRRSRPRGGPLALSPTAALYGTKGRPRRPPGSCLGTLAAARAPLLIRCSARTPRRACGPRRRASGGQAAGPGVCSTPH